jgi:hypothetical protein
MKTEEVIMMYFGFFRPYVGQIIIHNRMLWVKTNNNIDGYIKIGIQ